MGHPTHSAFQREDTLRLCPYCGLKVGFFKASHEQCLENAEAALQKLRSLIEDAVVLGTPALEVLPLIDEIKQQGRLTSKEADEALLMAADRSALALAHERPANNEVADQVYAIFMAISPTFLDDPKKCPGYISLSFSNTLFQVLHGEVPYFDPKIPISFQLSRDEYPILMRNTQLAEYRTISKGGGYQSVSFPVGGGMYYRLGTSLPRSEQTGLVLIDQGKLLITTRAIYFGGINQTLRLPYISVIRLESFADGIGVYPDHGNGKVFLPATLGFDDGWFFYNLVSAFVAQVRP